MRYYVHYLHFSDYCLHRHIVHNVSAVVRSGLLQVVRMSNLTLYFAYRVRLFHGPCLMDASYQLSPVHVLSESSLQPSPGIELTLYGYVTGSNQRLYPQYHVSLRTSVFEFLEIINLLSSATIFTSAHIAILLLSLHVSLPELILQLCCYCCFSLALLITGSHIVLISMLGRVRRFLGLAYVLIL